MAVFNNLEFFLNKGDVCLSIPAESKQATIDVDGTPETVTVESVLLPVSNADYFEYEDKYLNKLMKVGDLGILTGNGFLIKHVQASQGKQTVHLLPSNLKKKQIRINNDPEEFIDAEGILQGYSPCGCYNRPQQILIGEVPEDLQLPDAIQLENIDQLNSIIDGSSSLTSHLRYPFHAWDIIISGTHQPTAPITGNNGYGSRIYGVNDCVIDFSLINQTNENTRNIIVFQDFECWDFENFKVTGDVTGSTGAYDETEQTASRGQSLIVTIFSNINKISYNSVYVSDIYLKAGKGSNGKNEYYENPVTGEYGAKYGQNGGNGGFLTFKIINTSQYECRGNFNLIVENNEVYAGDGGNGGNGQNGYTALFPPFGLILNFPGGNGGYCGKSGSLSIELFSFTSITGFLRNLTINNFDFIFENSSTGGDGGDSVDGIESTDASNGVASSSGDSLDYLTINLKIFNCDYASSFKMTDCKFENIYIKDEINNTYGIPKNATNAADGTETGVRGESANGGGILTGKDYSISFTGFSVIGTDSCEIYNIEINTLHFICSEVVLLSATGRGGNGGNGYPTTGYLNVDNGTPGGAPGSINIRYLFTMNFIFFQCNDKIKYNNVKINDVYVQSIKNDVDVLPYCNYGGDGGDSYDTENGGYGEGGKGIFSQFNGSDGQGYFPVSGTKTATFTLQQRDVDFDFRGFIGESESSFLECDINDIDIEKTGDGLSTIRSSSINFYGFLSNYYATESHHDLILDKCVISSCSVKNGVFSELDTIYAYGFYKIEESSMTNCSSDITTNTDDPNECVNFAYNTNSNGGDNTGCDCSYCWSAEP